MTKLKKPIVITDIVRDPYYDEDYLFDKDTLTLTDKITVFVGPNGYGKTTLTKAIKEGLKRQGAFAFNNNAYQRNLDRGFRSAFAPDSEDTEEPITIGFMAYDSHADDHSNSISSALANDNFMLFALRKESSEGENNLYSLTELFNNAGAVAKEYPNLEQLVLFVDGIDSGLSVDMLDLIVRTLDIKIQQVESLNPNLEVAIVFTTNNYEMTRSLPTFDTTTFEPVSYDSYEDFRTDMLAKSTLKQ